MIGLPLPEPKLHSLPEHIKDREFVEEYVLKRALAIRSTINSMEKDCLFKEAKETIELINEYFPRKKKHDV